ncbi:MAG: DUF3035 domain-containing protein [Alphaproteobacteria bacterium]|nr:DUF3035 domain-containing protein [Alphaproteobacteria bacterium]
MKNLRYVHSGWVVLIGLVLAGCGDLTKAIGSLEGNSDLTGIKSPPLSLPPDYNLRPPDPGGRGSPNRQNVDQARQSVFGINEPGVVNSGAGAGTALNTNQRSAGESALLSKANASTKADQGIRSEVDEETEEIKESEAGFVDKILKWEEDGGEGENPQEEDGLKSIIAGEQKPVIKRKGGLFD